MTEAGEKSERYRRGYARLGELDPEQADRVIDSLKDIAPGSSFAFIARLNEPGSDGSPHRLNYIGRQ